MQKADSLLGKVTSTSRKKARPGQGSELPARASTAPDQQEADRQQKDHVDAINQIFAEFELAYHNQFHKAYGTGGQSIGIAKKYWLSCLADFPPQVILRAARALVSTEKFLPSLAAMIASCENAPALFGLPVAREAYLEACMKPHPRDIQQWSHPAVYLAGKNTGWFELDNEPEDRIFPLFEYHYSLLCRRVAAGEPLEVATPEPLPQTVAPALEVEDNRKKLHELKKNTGL